MADFKITPLADDIDFEHLPYWDVVVVGTGPAGLAASLTTAHRGLTTLAIEAKDEPGGQPEFLYGHKRIVDVPGFPDGILGEELSQRVYLQALNAKVQFRFEEELLAIEDTNQVEQNDRLHRVVTTKGNHLCRKVIVACGLLHFPRRLAVLDELQSSNVYYRIPKLSDYKGRRVAVLGGGDSALDAAIMVLERRGSVDVIVRSKVRGKADSLKRTVDNGGVVHTSCEVKAATLEGDRIRLSLSDGQNIVCDLVIVQIGYLSPRDTFQRLNLQLNDDDSIAVDQYFETSRPGIFAAGDVRGDIMLIPVAWAEGIQAAIYAFDEITRPFWLNEKRLHDHRIAVMGEKIKQAELEMNTSPATPRKPDSQQ